MFAALPVTRAIGSANGIIFKLKTMSEAQTDRAQRDLRLGTGTNIKADRWHSFEIHSEDDLRDALWWLGQAYEMRRDETKSEVSESRKLKAKKEIQHRVRRGHREKR